MADVRQSQASVINVDDALMILVQNVTEEFGLAPRDVYGGLFRFTATKDDHENAANQIGYCGLVDIAGVFTGRRQLSNVSHYVVAVHPYRASDRHEKWRIEIKSPRIGSKVLKSMESEQVAHLWETYGTLRGNSESSSLAGWGFEGLIHHMFSKGWEGPALQFTRMVRECPDHPVFSADPTATSSSLESCLRTRTPVDFPSGPVVPGVTLDQDRYYVPAMTNDLLHCPSRSQPTYRRNPHLSDYDRRNSWRISSGLCSNLQNRWPCTQACQGGEP